MRDWVKKLDSFLQFNERNVLTHAGKVSHELAQAGRLTKMQRHTPLVGGGPKSLFLFK
jgi:hypothetical protein